MINFPVYKKIKVDGYALYPGGSDGEGIDIDLTSGPWVVLGVNGLGKSTLLLILKHTLIGAVRARKPGFAGSTSDMFALHNRLFAVRVGDGAKSANSTLTIDLGSTTCAVTRRLSDLKLVSAKFCDTDEKTKLLTRMNIASYLLRQWASAASKILSEWSTLSRFS